MAKKVVKITEKLQITRISWEIWKIESLIQRQSYRKCYGRRYFLWKWSDSSSSWGAISRNMGIFIIAQVHSCSSSGSFFWWGIILNCWWVGSWKGTLPWWYFLDFDGERCETRENMVRASAALGIHKLDILYLNWKSIPLRTGLQNCSMAHLLYCIKWIV